MSRARDNKSTQWFVRITYPKAECKAKLDVVVPWAKTILALSHVGEKNEREHIHIAIEFTSEIAKQTMDVRFKKLFPVKGPDYSSKIWDGNVDALSYMFHDAQHEVLANKGHSDDDIQRYKELHKKVDAVVQQNKLRAPGRKVDLLLEKFAGEIPTRREIGIEFLRMIRSGEMYEPGDYKLKALIEECYMKLHVCEDDFKRYAESRMDTLLRY